jgi:hypothetical protein
MFIQISYPCRSSRARALPHEHRRTCTLRPQRVQTRFWTMQARKRGQCLASLVIRSKVAGNTSRMLDCRDAPSDGQPRGIGRVSQCGLSSSAYACCDRCRDLCATIIKHSHFCPGGTYVTIKASLRFPSRLARERAPTNGRGRRQGTKHGDERLRRAGHHLKIFEKAA